jgi:hypothetical protein
MSKENKNLNEAENSALNIADVMGSVFDDLKQDYRYVNDPKNNKSFDYKDGYNDAVRDLIIIVEKQTGVRLKF